MPAKKSMPTKMWIKLGCSILSLMLGAGVAPGTALWCSMIAKSGAGMSQCPPGVTQCDKQFLAVVNSVNAANAMGENLNFFFGVLFQKKGGRLVGIVGSWCLLCGWGGLLLPVLAVSFGTDAAFPLVFVFATAANTGSACMRWSLYAFMGQFQGKESLIMTLQNAGYQAGALVTVLLKSVASASGMEFPQLSVLQACLGGVCGVLVLSVVPSHAEERASMQGPSVEDDEDEKQAAQSGDTPEAVDVSVFGGGKLAMRIFCRNFAWHFLTAMTWAAGATWAVIYQSVVAQYGKLMFGTQAAGDLLASYLVVCTFVSSCMLSPVVSVFLAKIGIKTVFMGWSCILWIGTLLMTVPSWPAQQVVAFICVSVWAFNPVFMGEHIFAYVTAEYAGYMIQIFQSVFMFQFMFFQVVASVAVGSMPPGRDGMAAILAILVGAGASAYTLYFVLLVIRGLPERPVVLPEQELEYCGQFACGKFEEVAYILNLPVSNTIEQITSGIDKNAQAALVIRLSSTRMRTHLQKQRLQDIVSRLTEGKLLWNRKVMKFQSRMPVFGVVVPQNKLLEALSASAQLDQFGQGTSKSLGALKKELADDKTVLIVDENDASKVIRVVEIVILSIATVLHDTDHLLIETGLTYTSGISKATFRFPATKKSPDESVMDASNRILADMKMSSWDIEWDLASTENLIDEHASPSYPGLRTQYKKHLVHGKVLECDENNLAQCGLFPKLAPWKNVPLPPKAKFWPSWLPWCQPKQTKPTESYEWLTRDAILARKSDFQLTFPPLSTQKMKNAVQIERSQLMMLPCTANVTNMLRKRDVKGLERLCFEESPEVVVKGFKAMNIWVGDALPSYQKLMWKLFPGHQMGDLLMHNSNMKQLAVEVLLNDLLVAKQRMKQMLDKAKE